MDNQEKNSNQRKKTMKTKRTVAYSLRNLYHDFTPKKSYNKIFNISINKSLEGNVASWVNLLAFLGSNNLKVEGETNQEIAENLLDNKVISEYGFINIFKHLVGYLVNRGPFIFVDGKTSFLIYGVDTLSEVFYTSEGQKSFSVIKEKLNNPKNYGISAIIPG